MSNENLTIYDECWKFSYSQLNCFNTCKKMYYEIYLTGDRGSMNAFGQFGTFMHKIMEMYGKDEIPLFELVDYYKNNYNSNITIEFPKMKFCNMDCVYYNGGLNYLENFYGFNDVTLYCEYNVNGIITTDDNKKHFIGGVIDRVAKRKDNTIVLYDYKSKSKFKNKKEKEDYYRQLYLYAYLFWKSEGILPKKLCFVLMRAKSKDKINVEIDLNIVEMNNAVEWAKETITNILNCNDWHETGNQFFCKSLCAVSVLDCVTKQDFFVK